MDCVVPSYLVAECQSDAYLVLLLALKVKAFYQLS